MTTIPRIDAPDVEDFYNDFVLPRRPVIIRNFAPWKAFETWSIDHFRERFGDRTVSLDSGKKRMDAFLDDVVASTPDAPSDYLNQVPIAKEFPELLDDISPVPTAMQPNWLTNSLMLRRWGAFDGYLELFIGGAGSGFTRLHYDIHWINTMITQVVGAKEFTIFEPDDTPYLYQNPKLRNFSTIPRIDDVSEEDFPLFKNAKPIVFRVEPGETIYVPWGYWHATRILEPSIAVAGSTANAGNWTEFSQDFSSAGVLPHRMVKKAITALVSTVEAKKPVGHS